MATLTCLHHRPEGPYRSYARPLAWLELRCTAEGCEEQVIVWLNPEEARDYERGSRVFHDADFSATRVGDEGVTLARPALLKPLQRRLQTLRKTWNTRRIPQTRKRFKP